MSHFSDILLSVLANVCQREQFRGTLKSFSLHNCYACSCSQESTVCAPSRQTIMIIDDWPPFYFERFRWWYTLWLFHERVTFQQLIDISRIDRLGSVRGGDFFWACINGIIWMLRTSRVWHLRCWIFVMLFYVRVLKFLFTLSFMSNHVVCAIHDIIMKLLFWAGHFTNKAFLA